MPSFGRIGRQSNKSQQSLLEQQQQQHQQPQQPQQPSKHHHHHQHSPSLQLQQSAALQQLLLQQQSSATAGVGGALPHPTHPTHPTHPQPSPSAPSPSQRTLGSRKQSFPGLGLDSSNKLPSASSGPLPSLSPASSFHHQQDLQLQLPPLPLTPQQLLLQEQQQQQQHLQQADISLPGQALTTPQHQPQSQPQTPQHQHQLPHHPHVPLAGLEHASSREVLRKPNPNVPTSTNQGPTTISLNQSTQASSPGPSPAALYNLQQQQQLHHAGDNIAELTSRSQPPRNSQLIPPLQNPSPLGTASSSADDLLQGVSASPPAYRNPPSLSHSHTAPSDLKRSARKLIKHLLPRSSNHASDNYAHESHDNSSLGVARKPSNRASLLGRTNLFTVDHPDWVPPQKSSSRTRPRQQTQSQVAQPSPVQPSPVPSASQFENSYPIGRIDQDFAHKSQESLQTTVRHVQADVIESPLYDQENLAFYQRQAIAHHQAQLQQQQGSQAADGNTNQQPQQPHGQQPQHSQQPAQAQSQSQSHQQQQQDQQESYGQVTVDPAQNSYPWPQLIEKSQGSNHSSVYAAHLTTEVSKLSNPETVSQLSHESLTVDSEQIPDHPHSIKDASTIGQASSEFPLLSTQQHQQSQPAISPNMPPPATQTGAAAAQGRPSADNDRLRTAEPSAGTSGTYRHSQGPLAALSSLPPTPGVGPSAPSFRPSASSERQQYEGSTVEDRNRTNSPQPSENVDHETKLKEIVTKYKHVKRLYFEGKTQIEQMNAQIEQLQNAVANQRISQSRTALDDNEYSTRFKRLSGAINNLAFNIRKEWSSLPSWIEPYVTADAIKTGKQEMTAVGRAVISRWLMEEIFNRCFHPELEIDLSAHLKKIEQNIRKHSYTMTSQEEFDALTNKVVSWRMTTLEGLQHLFNSPESAEHRAAFTKMATSNLKAMLYRYLNDPPPSDVDGSATIIVELAVGIAANLPLESRDVALSFPMPGDLVQQDVMELEKQPLPALPDLPKESDENSKDAESAAKRGGIRSSMLAMPPGVPTNSRHGSTASIIGDAATTAATSATAAPKDGQRVRFAGFIGVEVRGRQVLSKAPIWTLP